ncbi:MAG: aminotransferase class V-fold PLP-dependent enzyme [Bryobacteraceae bacterium]
MRRSVYLDYHATTPVDPRVLEAMLPYFSERFGNAASRGHRFGWEAEKAVELARRQVAALAGADPREIVFTSGATESNNLALKGAAEAYRNRGGHLVTMTTEHRAVLDPVRRLERQGWRVTVLEPGADGLLDPQRLAAAIEPSTVLVSVMHANNEIGVVEPIAAIGALCRERGVLYHCDAAQSFGKIRFDVNAAVVDLASLTAHKICGPKGVGALYVRRCERRVELAPQMDGGGHEAGMRSGTLNVPGIVGFGAACAIAAEEMAEEATRVAGLRDRLLARLSALDGIAVNGSLESRLPGNLNARFAGIDASDLLTALPDVAVSTGSACSSAVPEPSHVLLAIGLSRAEARSSIRFGLGRFHSEDDIDFAAGRVVEEVMRLRERRNCGSNRSVR